MPHLLENITHIAILKAISFIELNGVPKDNEWNEYWIINNQKLYPFKYTVELASSFTNLPFVTTDFRSNDNNRKHIAALGFSIQYKAPIESAQPPKFWIGATYYNVPPNQRDMYSEFFKNGYWRTDHDLDHGTGLGLYKLLKKVRINDRLALRYFSRKKSTTDIIAIGTVKDISKIDDGRLDIVWDLNPRLYKGNIPTGNGGGNWWTTLFELKMAEDIDMIFGIGHSSERIARLTWNDNGYISPSGTGGKSKDRKTHEGQFGYGHEEWLFDTSKMIDGYHYGFLEPIRNHQNAYIGRSYNAWLFTINSDTGLRYIVGQINGLEAITQDEAAKVKAIYAEKGWLAEMTDQIKESGANFKGFSGFAGLDIFNVRYKPEHLQVYDPYNEVPESHAINGLTRYNLAFMKDKFRIEDPIDSETPFSYIEPTVITPPKGKKPKKSSSVRPPRAVEIVYLHQAISENLTQKLRTIYGDKNVMPEHRAGYGRNRIDIVVRDGNELVFYEIKTYNALSTSIREALGQLIEYAFWPSHIKAQKLIIVTQTPITEQAKLYFKHLRDTLKVPIFYQSYDLDNHALSKEY